MILFIYVHHMNHRMQITQESSEYDLMTNSSNFMQQTSSSLSEVTVVFVINTYCAPHTWQIVQKLKQALKTSVSGTNTGLQMFTPFTGMSLPAAVHVTL